MVHPYTWIDQDMAESCCQGPKSTGHSSSPKSTKYNSFARLQGECVNVRRITGLLAYPVAEVSSGDDKTRFASHASHALVLVGIHVDRSVPRFSWFTTILPVGPRSDCDWLKARRGLDLDDDTAIRASVVIRTSRSTLSRTDGSGSLSSKKSVGGCWSPGSWRGLAWTGR